MQDGENEHLGDEGIKVDSAALEGKVARSVKLIHAQNASVLWSQ